MEERKTLKELKKICNLLLGKLEKLDYIDEIQISMFKNIFMKAYKEFGANEILSISSFVKLKNFLEEMWCYRNIEDSDLERLEKKDIFQYANIYGFISFLKKEKEYEEKETLTNQLATKHISNFSILNLIDERDGYLSEEDMLGLIYSPIRLKESLNALVSDEILHSDQLFGFNSYYLTKDGEEVYQKMKEKIENK